MARTARRDALLEAAARVLGERGGHGTTMRDVARGAGIGLATLYHYVSSRDDLVYQVEVRLLQAAVASAEATAAVRGARERLRALVTDHVRRVMARPAEAAALAGRLYPLSGDRGRRVEALRQRYEELVQAAAGAATRGRQAGGRGRRSPAPVQLLLGMADRLALDAAARRPAPSPARLAGLVVGCFLAGAGARR